MKRDHINETRSERSTDKIFVRCSLNLLTIWYIRYWAGKFSLKCFIHPSLIGHIKLLGLRLDVGADNNTPGVMPLSDKPMTTTAEHDLLLPPPWINIEGVINIRDLGGYKCSQSQIVKPLTIFRSGEPSRITERGRQQLRALGVTTFFDLRNDGEVVEYKSEVPPLEGVQIIKPWQTESNRSFDPLRM